MSTHLEKILIQKRASLERWKTRIPPDSLSGQLRESDRDFAKQIQSVRPAFILEFKRASPSRGVLRPQFDLAEIAGIYARYATCVSVLSEEDFFHGSLENVRTVRQLLPQPILCKDFFFETYQVELARHFGADAVLLMLAVLSDREYSRLSAVAAEWKMAVLTEVSTELEAQRALALGASLIGINNRDLRTLQVDLEQTPRLARRLQGHAVLISESGYTHSGDVQRNRPYVDGFLVGSSLMASADLHAAVRELISAPAAGGCER